MQAKTTAYKSKYMLAAGARLNSATAQQAGEVCEQLALAGRLTPAELVEASRPEDAPLHGEFEWNIEKAAQNWNESQARYIIRSIVVQPKPDDKKSQPVRSFVHVPGEKSNTYEHISTVYGDEAKTARLLTEAFREMRSFIRKYRNLTELVPVIDAMQDMLEEKAG